MDHSEGGRSLTSSTNYNWNKNHFVCDCDVESGPAASFYSPEITSWHAFSNETRLASSLDGPFNFLAGIYYQKTKRVFDQYAWINVEDSSQPPELQYLFFHKNSETRGETISPFAQLTFEPVENLELSGGVRYIHETKDSYFTHPYVNAALLALYPQGVVTVSDQTFNNWSPEATISYQATPDILVYGSYKTAYKSGGFSNSGSQTFLGSDADLSFDPERARGFEIGLKSSLFDKQVRLNIAAFRYKYTNLQIDFFNAETFGFISTNAGSARTQGVELQAEFAPRSAPGLRLRGAANYNRARYIDYIAPCYTGQKPSEGCTTVAFGTFGQDLSGRQLAVAPEFTAALGIDYEKEVGRFLLGLSIDGNYSDRYNSSAFANPLTVQPSFVTLDATLRLGTVDERWQFSVIGRNLTNRFIVTGSNDAAGSGSGTGTEAGVISNQAGYVQGRQDRTACRHPRRFRSRAKSPRRQD